MRRTRVGPQATNSQTIRSFVQFVETDLEESIVDFGDEDVVLEENPLPPLTTPFSQRIASEGMELKLIINHDALLGDSRGDLRRENFQKDYKEIIAEIVAIGVNNPAAEIQTVAAADGREGNFLAENLDPINVATGNVSGDKMAASLALLRDKTFVQLKKIFQYQGGDPSQDANYEALSQYITKIAPPIPANFLEVRKDFCKKLIEGAYFVAHEKDGRLQDDIGFHHAVFHAKVVAVACVGGAISSVESLFFSPDAWWPQFVEELIIVHKDKVRLGLETHLGPFFGSVAGLETLDENFRLPGFEMPREDLEEAIKPILLSDAEFLIPSISRQYYDLIVRAENNALEEMVARKIAQQVVENSYEAGEEITEEYVRGKIKDGDEELLRLLYAGIDVAKKDLAKSRSKEEEKIFATYNNDKRRMISGLVSFALRGLRQGGGEVLGLQAACPISYKALYASLRVFVKSQIYEKEALAASDKPEEVSREISDDEIRAHFKSTEFENDPKVIQLIKRHSEIVQQAKAAAKQSVLTKSNITDERFQEIMQNFEEKENLEADLRSARDDLISGYLNNNDNPILKLVANCGHNSFFEIEGEEGRKAVLKDYVIEMLLSVENSDPNKQRYVAVAEVDRESFALVLKALSYALKNKEIPIWLQRKITAKAKETEAQAEGEGALIYLAERVIKNESSKSLLQKACDKYVKLPETPTLQDLIASGASYSDVKLFLKNNPTAIQNVVRSRRRLKLRGLFFHPEQTAIINLITSKVRLSIETPDLIAAAESLFDFSGDLEEAINEKDGLFFRNYLIMHHDPVYLTSEPYRYVLIEEDFGANFYKTIAKAIKLYSKLGDIKSDEKNNALYGLLYKVKVNNAYLRLGSYILSRNLYKEGPVQFLKDVIPCLKAKQARKLFLSLRTIDFFRNEESANYYLGTMKSIFSDKEVKKIMSSSAIIEGVRISANQNKEVFQIVFAKLNNDQKKLVIFDKDGKSNSFLFQNLVSRLSKDEFKNFFQEAMGVSSAKQQKQIVQIFLEDVITNSYLVKHHEVLKIILESLPMQKRVELAATKWIKDQRSPSLLENAFGKVSRYGDAIEIIMNSLDEATRKSVLFHDDDDDEFTPLYKMLFAKKGIQDGVKQPIEFFTKYFQPKDYPLSLRILLDEEFLSKNKNLALDLSLGEVLWLWSAAAKYPEYLDNILRNADEAEPQFLNNFTFVAKISGGSRTSFWTQSLGEFEQREDHIKAISNVLNAAKKYPRVREALINAQDDEGNTVTAVMSVKKYKAFFNLLTPQEAKKYVELRNNRGLSFLSSAINFDGKLSSIYNEMHPEHKEVFDYAVSKLESERDKKAVREFLDKMHPGAISQGSASPSASFCKSSQASISMFDQQDRESMV